MKCVDFVVRKKNFEKYSWNLETWEKNALIFSLALKRYNREFGQAIPFAKVWSVAN